MDLNFMKQSLTVLYSLYYSLSLLVFVDLSKIIFNGLPQMITIPFCVNFFPLVRHFPLLINPSTVFIHLVSREM